jgi:hypothetical protein
VQHANRDVDGAELMRRLASRSLVAATLGALLSVPGAAGAAAAEPPEEIVTTTDGYSVRVQVSPAYGSDRARGETVVHMLDGMMHGAEIARLRIVVVPPAEAEARCGAGALACYYGDRMVVPGEQPPSGPPVAYLVAHEYAHHILAYRRNDPWSASSWGAKRWATELQVCPEVHRHELFLGYSSVPGEAFAETYAMQHFPQLHLAWQYTDLLAPDDHTESALRRDVLQPWMGPTLRTYRGTLRAGGSRALALRFPLDGTARISVTGRPRVAVELRAGGRVLARARPRGGRTRASATICGQRHGRVRLTAVRGSGAYTVRVSRP